MSKSKIIYDTNKINEIDKQLKLLVKPNKSKSGKPKIEIEDDGLSYCRFDHKNMVIESIRMKKAGGMKSIVKEKLQDIIMTELEGEFIDSKYNISPHTYRQLERYPIVASELRKIANDIDSKVQIINQRLIQAHLEVIKI